MTEIKWKKIQHHTSIYRNLVFLVNWFQHEWILAFPISLLLKHFTLLSEFNDFCYWKPNFFLKMRESKENLPIEPVYFIFSSMKAENITPQKPSSLNHMCPFYGKTFLCHALHQNVLESLLCLQSTCLKKWKLAGNCQSLSNLLAFHIERDLYRTGFLQEDYVFA